MYTNKYFLCVIDCFLLLHFINYISVDGVSNLIYYGDNYINIPKKIRNNWIEIYDVAC
jgi:hypothetical protein